MQILIVLIIILAASYLVKGIADLLLNGKKESEVTVPEATKEEYPIVMSASVPSSSSSVLGKVEAADPQIPEASPELIAAVKKTVAKPKPKKKAVKKEIEVKKERKPKDKGNDMLLS
jgi:hypothetical protein